MNTNNLILASLREVEEESKLYVPEGYAEIKLSTKGKVGAPAIFHIRNFKVGDIISLSLTSERELPSRLIPLLNEMILEDVNVAQWHEKEVEELMVNIFVIFYKDTLDEINFPVQKEDLDYLKSIPEKASLAADIENKKWTPKTTITISKDVDTYDLVDDFSPRITITNKKTGFHVTFDYVKYGDQLIIKKWIDSYFEEEEEKFKLLKEQLNFNNNVSRQIRINPSAVNTLIEIDPELEQEYKDYQTRKLQAITNVVRIISIVDYNGRDVSNMSLSDKYELMVNDARIDYGLISKLAKRQEKNPWGIKPEVRMVNPITNQQCLRRFSFRIPAILQAMQLSGDDIYDDGYGNEA